MKNLSLYFALLFCLFFFDTYGQSRIKLEMYTGPQYGYQKLLNDPEPSLDFNGLVANHIGLGILYGIGNDWQLSLQSELTGIAFNYTGFIDFPEERVYRNFDVRGGNLWNHRLGLRKNWEKGNHAFFVQPSIGLTLQRYSEINKRDSISSIQFFTYKTAVVANASLEAGVKFYTKTKNYFSIGVRHQQGLGVLDVNQFRWMQFTPTPELQRRGSYTGLVLGYGIDFKGRSADEIASWRLGREERKRERRDAAWGDGAYVMVSGLLRFRSSTEKQQNLEFSHISGGNEFLGGYTFGALSVESGYGRLNAYTNAVIGDGALNIHTPTDYTVNVIPLRIRYHRNIGDKNRLRVGVSGATFYTLSTHGSLWYRGVTESIEPLQYSLSSSPLEQNSKGKVFFNAGVFTEVPVFNSSMLTFNLSRNFGSPKVGKVNIIGEVNGEPVNFDASGSLNGWMWEFGYKLPLNRIFR